MILGRCIFPMLGKFFVGWSQPIHYVILGGKCIGWELIILSQYIFSMLGKNVSAGKQ